MPTHTHKRQDNCIKAHPPSQETQHSTAAQHTHPIESQPSPPHAPLILLASWISFCIIVTLFAWMAHRFVSSKRCTRNASDASCSAWMACDCHRISYWRPLGRNVMAISRTWKIDLSIMDFSELAFILCGRGGGGGALYYLLYYTHQSGEGQS